MNQDIAFEALLTPTTRDRAYLALPFDPERVWGKRDIYRIGGVANGQKFRGLVEFADGEWRLMLGQMWIRDAGLTVGETLKILAHIEGPQRADLDPDIAAALAAEPVAAAFWDNLAQFYRKAYLTWIAGTKRRPDVRAERIAEVVRLLRAGVKSRS